MNNRRFKPIYKNPTVNADSFDKRRFNELLHMSKGLQNVRKQGKIPHFEQLMGDVWSSFFKSSPKLIEREEISPELYLNHSLMERVLDDESYQETHQYTTLDDFHSALSTIGFSQKLTEWINEMIENNNDLQQAYQKLIDQQQSKTDSEQFQEAMQQFSEKMSQCMNNQGIISQMLKESVDETKKIEQNLKDLFSGIKAGNGSKDELKLMPLRDQFALAEYLKNNYKMKKIAEWAGRFKAIARSKQKSISKESIARSGVAIGSDIDSLLASELTLINHPAAKMDFLKRFAEGQTLQYQKRGKQTLGKGPIILCLDQSGSMERLDSQSKGFALALMSIAKHQRRDFALITFNRKSIVRQYPKGKISTKQMIELCEHFLGGGTDFQSPLSEALKLLKGSRFKNADIVFVTDGEAGLGNDFLKLFYENKKKMGFEVVSILIGNHANEETVNLFSEKVFKAKDFADSEAHEVFKI